MRTSLTKIFYAIFAVIFSLLVLNIIFNPYNNFYNYYPIKTYKLLIYLTLEACVIIAAFWLIRKFSKFLTKWYTHILIAFCVIMFITQMYFAHFLRFTPQMDDIGQIFYGAIAWLQEGTFSNSTHISYFSYWPNNLGILTLFRFLFGIASIVGISDFFMVATVVNSLLCCTTFACISLICRKLFKENGAVAGIMSLILIALTLPFYFCAVAFYTDFMSMLFPALGFLLYLNAQDTKSPRKWLLYSAMGLVIIIGTLIKPTVFIIFIAIAIHALLTKRFAEILYTLAVISVISVSFNVYIYSNHLSWDIARNETIPILHWVHMGLSGEYGQYNHDDFMLTHSLIRDPNQKTILANGILNRLKANRITFYLNKAKHSFGDGTLKPNWYPPTDSDNPNKIYQLVMSQKESTSHYPTFATAHLILLYILLIISAINKANKHEFNSSTVVHLSTFGLCLFLMCWESQSKYITNFVPIFIIGAVMGIESLTRKEHP